MKTVGRFTIICYVAEFVETNKKPYLVIQPNASEERIIMFEPEVNRT